MACLKCNEDKPIFARNLCSRCYRIDRKLQICSGAVKNSFGECKSCLVVQYLDYPGLNLCKKCYYRQWVTHMKEVGDGECKKCGIYTWIKSKAKGLCEKCYTYEYDQKRRPKKLPKPLMQGPVKIIEREPIEVEGLTLEERKTYTHRKAQGCINPRHERKSGPCESCKVFQDPLYADHCHTTGLSRGWLCVKCNLALGYVDDDIEKLKNLITYLKTYPHTKESNQK